MCNLHFEGVGDLEVVEAGAAAAQTELGGLAHEAELGVNVGFLFLVFEGVPVMRGIVNSVTS